MFRAPSPQRVFPRGNALGPILIIVAALGISALVFFLFTRPQMQKDKEVAEAQSGAPQATAPGTSSAPAAPSGATSPGAPAVASGTPAPAAPKPAPTPAPAPAREAKPEDLAKEFAFMVTKNDLASAAKILAGDDDDQTTAVQAMLQRVFRELGYKPSAPGQPEFIGQEGDILRLAIPLTSTKPGAPSARLMLDLERDDKGAWKVSKVHLPKELESSLAGLPGPPPGTRAAEHPLIVVDQGPDSLVFASNFVNTMLKLDFPGARKFVDLERVSPVKLAALCIVFEDGKYRLSDNKPLVATVSTENTSWVITRVWSDTQRQQTEFGLEMEKAGADWRITGVNLSKLLSDNARATSADGVPYTPLVQSPKGGDSIALFFEYDQAVLHPRAQKQLDIIVGLLKASPTKKLTISGFTDARGSDQYNVGLSQRRAVAVKEYLLAHEVPASQVETTGFGKNLPLSPNVKPDGTDNPEGRSRNRRAEILLDF